MRRRAGEALPPLEPWGLALTIPWDEPGFARRMLQVHLSQELDAASRRTELIETHVRWIDRLLDGPSRLLDLGCGPGLYAHRLAAMGHRVHGIDFSAISLEHARAHAPHGASFQLGELSSVDYGGPYDLVMQVYGEANVFRPEALQTILGKAHAALRPGGTLLLEVQTAGSLVVAEATHEYDQEGGLFADGPHHVVQQQRYDEASRTRIMRWVVSCQDEPEWLDVYEVTTAAHPFEAWLEEAGFVEATFHESMGESPNPQPEFVPITARRP